MSQGKTSRDGAYQQVAAQVRNTTKKVLSFVENASASAAAIPTRYLALPLSM